MRRLLIISLIVSAVVATALPSTVAGATPEGCISYAYAADYGSGHYSLIRNGSLLVGSLIISESDCGPFVLVVDGVTVGGGDSIVSATIPLSSSSVSMVGDDWRADWVNLSFMAGSDFVAAISLYEETAPPGALWLTPSEVSSREVWVAVGTAFILWVLVVAALDRVIRYWMETRFCEEVIA